MIKIAQKREYIYLRAFLCFKMVATKGAERASQNWNGAIGTVQAKYSEGIQGADNVIEKAIAAESLFAERMQAAIANQTRAKGLAKTSTAEWKDKALKKGAARIAAGMTESKDKFKAGIGRVIAVIEGVTIAPKTADVTANVMGRVAPIAVALRNAKQDGTL